MLKDSVNITEFVMQLHTATTLDEAFAIYDKQVQNLGFEGALYAFIPRLQLETQLQLSPLFKISESRNPAFIKHYHEARLEQHDFTLHHVLKGNMTPLDWGTEAKKGTLNAAENNLLTLAREDYGIRHGISMCTMFDEIGIAGASVVSTEADHIYQRLVDERLNTLRVCIEIFHAHLMLKPHFFYYFLIPLLENLTSKEKKLLRFIAEGRPMKSSGIPDITYRYSDKLMQNIRAKFGGISKGRLIYYIGLLRLLNYL